ncbi:MAG: biopolymer transporter ExbD [Verrucomicrobiales bacterium]|nr:biopolymer transporter ExbD [Verrucomicrobiales bacterium]
MNFRPHQQMEDSPVDYLVPLMDVLFILITFFVIAFSMSRMETEVNISVPASESTQQQLQDVGQIVVNVRAGGTLVVNQQVLTEPQLLDRVRTIATVNAKQAIVVRGDENAAYKHIFRVLDNCRKAGLYHVSFASQSPQETKPN